MARAELPTSLVGDIYEAAVSDAAWPGMAGIATRAIGVENGAIVDRGRILDFSITEDGSVTQGPFLAHHSKLDVWNQSLRRGPLERPPLGYDLFPQRQLVKTEFSNDFARPVGIFRPMAAVMALGGETLATLSAVRLGIKNAIGRGRAPAGR